MVSLWSCGAILAGFDASAFVTGSEFDNGGFSCMTI